MQIIKSVGNLCHCNAMVTPHILMDQMFLEQIRPQTTVQWPQWIIFEKGGQSESKTKKEGNMQICSLKMTVYNQFGCLTFYNPNKKLAGILIVSSRRFMLYNI